MKIYFAGLPAGWPDHENWASTERKLYRKCGVANRLMSYHFIEHTMAYLEFRRHDDKAAKGILSKTKTNRQTGANKKNR
jgi:hypothetical protein